MDINKHNRLETYATKAIRYWTSNDIIDWLKTSITTLKIEIPEEDINIYCKRVETEKCDGNCLLGFENVCCIVFNDISECIEDCNYNHSLFSCQISH